MLRIANIPAPLSFTYENEKEMKRLVAGKLGISQKKITSASLAKKSVDARDKGDIHFVIAIDFSADNENELLSADKHHILSKVNISPQIIIPHSSLSHSPVVVGCGPAGLFAALTLAKAGAKPVVIERGKPVEERQKDVEAMISGGVLNPNSNVQFGEGGAGTFSDGKLTTGIKSPYQRVVLETFVAHGAPKEILWEQKPHIGTDLLREIVSSMRKEIINLGGKVLFNTKLTRLIIRSGSIVGVETEDTESNGKTEEITTDNVLLALGHSSRDTLPILLSQGVVMTQKPFAMGVRIEHSQQAINTSQYGKFAGRKELGAAPYKLAVHTPDGRGVYTFCMCPGGSVIPSASEAECLVTNGMSKYARDEANSNAALLVGISTNDFPNAHPLAGMEMQRKIEHSAFVAGGGRYKAPVQLVGDFLQGKVSSEIGSVVPSYKPGYTLCDLHDVLPEFMAKDLKLGIAGMDRQLKGFAAPDAVLTAVESRTSSPVRLNRNRDYMCSTVSGLYPIGEGAGYAGGIVSAAVDGISAAMAVLQK